MEANAPKTSTTIDLEPTEANAAKTDAAKNEFLIVNANGAESELDGFDGSLADAKISEANARINSERSKIEMWEAMQKKIAAKQKAVERENYAEALALKNEITALKETLKKDDLKWVNEKQKEKDENEAIKAYQLGKKMTMQTMLKVSAKEHGGNDVHLLVKHNKQIQFELYTRKNAGWSNGEPRSQQDIDEFSIGTRTSTGSASASGWTDFTSAHANGETQ